MTESQFPTDEPTDAVEVVVPDLDEAPAHLEADPETVVHVDPDPEEAVHEPDVEPEVHGLDGQLEE